LLSVWYWIQSEEVAWRNDAWLLRSIGNAEEVVAAWGNNGAYLARDRAVLAMLERPKCLGVSQRGFPKHPLNIRATKKAARSRRT
jgi:hypothetical protein